VRGVFVTGTDTGAGKTYVACAIARRAVAAGLRVFGYKPLETGCERRADGSYVGLDGEALAAAAGDWQRGRQRGAYRFALPAAPWVAAAAEGAEIDLADVVQIAEDAMHGHPGAFAVVEGAGGWRVPISADADMGALARRLALPVVVVARAGLGTINHSLLTVEAVERDGLGVEAVVLSRRPDEGEAAAASNRDQICRRWRGRVVLFDGDEAALDVVLGPR